MQERLAKEPFRLLLATIFLNKTRGAVALPVFYELMDRYSTPAALAAAQHADVVSIIQHLGLQNQRATKFINMAKTWLEHPPEKGKRYRCLHYPKQGDGRDVKRGEVLEEEDKDPRVGWEVAHLPGIGAYAFDSWRIFCRDDLRGLCDLEEMDGEWTRVLPLDKELRAYLRWRWLKAEWEWDPLTGGKKKAGAEVVQDAMKGGVIYEGDAGARVCGERTREGAVVGSPDGEALKREEGGGSHAVKDTERSQTSI